MVVIEEGKVLFVHTVAPEKTQKKTSQTENDKLFVIFFHARC